MNHQHRFLSTIVLVVFCLSLLQNVYFLLPSVAQQQQEAPCAAAQRLVEDRAETLRIAVRKLKEIKDRGYMRSMIETGTEGAIYGLFAGIGTAIITKGPQFNAVKQP